MISRRSRDLLFSGAGLALTLAALGAVNVLSLYWHARADFSAGRAYSISAGTRAVLSRLDDNLVIRVYFTSRLPPPYSLTEQYLRDLLGEYRSVGGGRVRVEFIDPSSSEVRRLEAAAAGVAAVPINMLSRDKFEAAEVMMGVVFLYKGKTAVLPVVEDADNLEYALTKHVKRLVDAKRRSLGFVAGHGERSPEDPASAAFFGLVREGLEARSVALDKPVPAYLDALWIVEPSTRLKPAELAALKGWVASGKTLGVVAGRRAIDFNRFVSVALDVGLTGLLAEWGLDMSPGLVVDARCQDIQVRSSYGDYVAQRVEPYPYMPISKRLDRDNPATRALDAVTFRFVHALAPRAGAHWASLADSSRESWLRDSHDVSTGVPIEKMRSGPQGPFSLAGILSTGRGTVIVVASQYAVDPRLPSQPSSVAFFLNLLDWSTQDSDLSSIRAKGLAYRPLRPLPEGARAAVKLALIFFLPLVLLCCGAAAYVKRRAASAALPGLYADA